MEGSAFGSLEGIAFEIGIHSIPWDRRSIEQGMIEAGKKALDTNLKFEYCEGI